MIRIARLCTLLAFIALGPTIASGAAPAPAQNPTLRTIPLKVAGNNITAEVADTRTTGWTASAGTSRTRHPSHDDHPAAGADTNLGCGHRADHAVLAASEPSAVIGGGCEGVASFWVKK